MPQQITIYTFILTEETNDLYETFYEIVTTKEIFFCFQTIRVLILKYIDSFITFSPESSIFRGYWVIEFHCYWNSAVHFCLSTSEIILKFLHSTSVIRNLFFSPEVMSYFCIEQFLESISVIHFYQNT